MYGWDISMNNRRRATKFTEFGQKIERTNALALLHILFLSLKFLKENKLMVLLN